MDKNQKLFKKKNNINSFVKSMSMGFSLLVGLIFFILIIFISIMAVKGFQEYGSGILFSGDFSEYSFWVPFSVTAITSLIAIIVRDRKSVV